LLARVQLLKLITGLSIHYNGRFKTDASLKELIDDVLDVVRLYDWEHFVFETEFPPALPATDEYTQDIYGICFTPPKCETVSICLLSNRWMSDAAHLQFYGNATSEEERGYLYSLSVKTQYAGIEIHNR
jgi:hypothetical protein